MIALVIVVLLVVAIIIIAACVYDRVKYQSELGPPPSRKGSMRLVSWGRERKVYVGAGEGTEGGKEGRMEWGGKETAGRRMIERRKGRRGRGKEF